MEPNIYQVIRYLKKIDNSVRIYGDSYILKDNVLSGVNTFENAVTWELSWVSPKKLSENPIIIKQFKGSMLICPSEVTIDDLCGFVIISCRNAKLAFIRVINEFFEDLSIIKWPSPEEGPIFPDTVIGEAVIISHGVVIGANVSIGDHVSIGPNTVITNCKIGQGTNIGSNCSIGLPGFGYAKDDFGNYLHFPHVGSIILGENVDIGSNTCIDRGVLGNTVIGKGSKVDNLVHIAHNVVLGENSMVIANSMLGGGVILGNNVWVAPSVSIMNQAAIGDSAVLGLGAVVLKNVEPSTVMVGNPAKKLRKKVEIKDGK